MTLMSDRNVPLKKRLYDQGKPLVNRCGIRDKKDEDDDSGRFFHHFAVIALGKELRKGGDPHVAGHAARPLGQEHPGKKCADQGVADADPGGGDAESPTKPAGITYKNDSREVRGHIGKRRQPGTHFPAADNEVIRGFDFFLGDNAYDDHGCQERDQNQILDHTLPTILPCRSSGTTKNMIRHVSAF